MASSLANQLRTIAATSTNTLDTRALKQLHSTSLIFPRTHAATQDLHSVFNIAQEGFQELCALDERFVVFERGLFSETSKDVNRFLQTKTEVAELDHSIEAFLELVSAKLLLRPAMKAVEWLVRRFRIQDQNTTALLMAFLPYHSHPTLFPALLAIIAEKDLIRELQFLRPYLKPPTAVPRHVITHALSHRRDTLDLLVSHTTATVRSKRAGHPLLSFFTAVTVEAIALMCDAARTSARTGVTEEEVLRKALPLVEEMFAAKKTAEFQIGGYMLATVVVSKVPVREEILVGLTRSLTLKWTDGSLTPALACLALITEARTSSEKRKLPDKVVNKLLAIEDLTDRLIQMAKKYRVDNLIVSVCNGALARLGSRFGEAELNTVVELLENAKITPNSRKAILGKLVTVAQDLKFEALPEQEAAVRDIMATNLLNWSEKADTKLGKILQTVFEENKVDIELLELALRTVIRRPAIETPNSEVMAIEAVPEKPADFETVLTALPKSTRAASFLVQDGHNALTSQLEQAFMLASRKTTLIQTLFEHQLFKASPTLPLTLLAHIWSSRHTPIIARAAALKYASKLLVAKTEYQSLIPFALVALCDTSDRVRREATGLLTALKSHFDTLECATPKKKSKPTVEGVQYYGYSSLYGAGTPATEGLKWLTTFDAHKFLIVFLSRGGAESIIDPSYATRALAAVLNSSAGKSKGEERLKTAQKSSVLVFLAAHAVNVPALSVQLQLLKMLNAITNAPASRTDFLLPVLEGWAAKPRPERAEAERVPLHELEQELVRVVAEGSEMADLKPLVDIIEKDLGGDGLVAAATKRIIELWSSLEEQIQVALTEFMLEIRLVDGVRAAEAMEILGDAPIPTQAFDKLFDKARTTLKGLFGAGGAAGNPKRTRRSSGGVNAAAKEKELNAAVLRVTVLVELLESQGAYKHPDMLRVLFMILADVGSAGVEFSGVTYLQSLLLSCVKDILQGHKINNSNDKFTDAIRADVLVSCIRSTSSPQVQNSALLLLANLADIAPDTVKHSVMPIFTFMGANTLRQDDEYSAYVIEQTVQRVIPPLIKDHSDSTDAAELITTFVNNYKHVPTHRRMRLFSALTETLGPDNFLFAVLAKLAGKYYIGDVPESEVREFSVQLASSFGAEVQIASVVKYLDTVHDVLAPSATGPARMLFSTEESSRDIPSSELARRLLGVLKAVLSSDRLAARVANTLASASASASASAAADTLRDLFARTIEKTMALGESYPAHATDCAVVMDSLLSLLSTREFVTVISTLLDGHESLFRASALSTFRSRLLSNHRPDASALELAPKIAAIITSASSGDTLKADALLCIQALTTKFGPFDPSAIAALTDSVVSAGALKSPDTGLRVLSLVVLTNMATALAGRIVPVLPKSVPHTLVTLASTVESSEPTSEQTMLHNAALRFLQELVTVVPSFMASYLPRLLPLLASSAGVYPRSSIRTGLQNQLADSLDLKTLLAALSKYWPAEAAAQVESILIAQRAISRATKGTVQKTASQLQSYFLVSLTAEDIAPTLELVIAAVLKLNDTIFRPMFDAIVEWAITTSKEAERAQETMYALLHALNTNLGALMLDYVTPVLPHTAEVLVSSSSSSSSSTDPDSKVQKAALQALTESFVADNRDWWQFPSAFSLISTALLAPFTTTPAPVSPSRIAAIVELASLSAATEPHAKTINTALLKGMGCEESADVRLAATSTLKGIYEKVGEEWLGLLAESLPAIAEVLEDDVEEVEREGQRLVAAVEKWVGKGEMGGMLG